MLYAMFTAVADCSRCFDAPMEGIMAILCPFTAIIAVESVDSIVYREHGIHTALLGRKALDALHSIDDPSLLCPPVNVVFRTVRRCTVVYHYSNSKWNGTVAWVATVLHVSALFISALQHGPSLTSAGILW
ncbi:unnamed protein product, partial [Sphacelaria rigidula]